MADQYQRVFGNETRVYPNDVVNLSFSLIVNNLTGEELSGTFGDVAIAALTEVADRTPRQNAWLTFLMALKAAHAPS